MAQNLYRMNSIACGVYQGEKKADADSSKADHLAKRKKELEEKKTKNLQVNFDWEEKEELGKGSFGTVVLGINKQTGQHMAVKKLLLGKKKLATEETKREIKLLSELDDNKYVVKLIGFKQNDTTMFVFMEYVEQGSLETQIKKFGVIDEELVSKYTYQILMGLAHLHANGVVHGDLKCANILLDRKGDCKLADFGSSQKVLKGQNTNNIFGTICWMAPEIIMQQGFDLYADIWSLGCTVFEMLTGYPPFYENNDSQWTIMHKIAGTTALPYLPDEKYSEEARDFVYSCMRRVPDQRPTAQELLNHPFIMRYKSKLETNGEERDFGHNATVIEDTSAADKFVKETKELSNADFKAAQNFQDKQISSVQDVYKKKMSMDFTYSGKIDASIRDNINGDPNSPSKTSIIGSPSFSKHRSEDILTKFEYLININTQTKLSDYNDSAIESPRGLQDAQLKMPCLRALMQEFPPKVPPYDILTLLQSPATEQVSSSQALPTLPPSRSGTFIKPPSLIRLQPASNPGNMKMMRKNESLLNASIFDQGFDPEEYFLARANLRPFDDDKGNVGASPKNNKAILKDFTPNTPQKSVLNSMRRTSWVDPNILN